MKIAVVLAGLTAALFGAEVPRPLAEVLGPQVIYVMPMTRGFEQYLANQLTERNVFPVTTDVKQASAVLTDSIGSVLELRMREAFQAPPAAPTGDKKADDAALNAQLQAVSLGRPASTLSRGRGNLYLVDVKSRRVLWSGFVTPKDFQPRSLNRAAGRVAESIRKAATPVVPKA